MKMSFSIYCLMVCFLISPTLSWWKGGKKPKKWNGNGGVPGSLAAICEKLEEIHDKLEICIAVPECPDGWVRFDKSCYFIQDSTMNITQDQAQWLCKDQNPKSDLVAVQTVAELNFLTNTLVELFPDIANQTSSTWITSGVTVDGNRIWAKTGQAVGGDVFMDTDSGECIAFDAPDFDFLEAVACGFDDRQFIFELHL